MSKYHTVAQGEHVSSIAWSYGFSDYQTIWNHPNNADLKAKRHNPNVLFPGDNLFIPDLEHREELRPTDNRHEFVLSRPVLKLRLKIEDQYEKPIAGAPCVLAVDGDFRNLNSDAQGKLELEIPPSAQQSYLVIQDDSQTPFAGVMIPIRIGHLDPVEEVSGQQARLQHLGYYFGDIDGQPSADFESAVEEFQCDQGLKVDGVCGPRTQSTLKATHGC
jgi:N-acetylmuramoyl-L-alanine amidase